MSKIVLAGTSKGSTFHYFDSDGKSVWAHSVVSSHVVSQGYSLPWDFRVYRRKEDCEVSNIAFRSNVEIVMEPMQSVAAVDDTMYVWPISAIPAK